MNSCAQPAVPDEFYLALTMINDPEKTQETVKLLENSLENPNMFIRQAASEQLSNLNSNRTELSSRTNRLVRRETSGSWALVYEAIEKSDKNTALNFLLNFTQNDSEEARNFALRILSFSETELAAIEAHYSILSLNYNEALLHFRAFQEDGAWTERLPSVFIEHPQLIVDLGRAFQYTSFGSEGLSLFLQWDSLLEDTEENALLIYRLQFYAARIARRIGRRAQAVSLFEQALLLAPDKEQSQACIWYILDMALSESASSFLQQLEKYAPVWGSGNYFNDVLETFLQQLFSRRDWKNIIEVYRIIRETSASVKSAYAWIIARGIQENLLNTDERGLASAAGNFSFPSPTYFMNDAYNGAFNEAGSFLYYRLLSAKFFDRPLFEMQEEEPAPGQLSPAAQFILGFFTFSAGGHAMRYLSRFEEELPADELRMIAAALSDEGMYIQSIQLALRYINREGHIITRRDMELLFPCPYRELVEMYAEQTGIAPHLLFGLIRTESAFQSAVVSSAGAVGLTQLMPATALDMAGRIRRSGGPDYEGDEGLKLDDPSQNIHIGSFYLGYLMDRFDDELLSLLAYNGGMNRVRNLRAASPLPADLFLETISIGETRDYGRKVTAAAAVYEWLYY